MHTALAQNFVFGAASHCFSNPPQGFSFGTSGLNSGSSAGSRCTTSAAEQTEGSLPAAFAFGTLAPQLALRKTGRAHKRTPGKKSGTSPAAHSDRINTETASSGNFASMPTYTTNFAYQQSTAQGAGPLKDKPVPFPGFETDLGFDQVSKQSLNGTAITPEYGPPEGFSQSSMQASFVFGVPGNTPTTATKASRRRTPKSPHVPQATPGEPTATVKFQQTPGFAGTPQYSPMAWSPVDVMGFEEAERRESLFAKTANRHLSSDHDQCSDQGGNEGTSLAANFAYQCNLSISTSGKPDATSTFSAQWGGASTNQPPHAAASQTGSAAGQASKDTKFGQQLPSAFSCSAQQREAATAAANKASEKQPSTDGQRGETLKQLNDELRSNLEHLIQQQQEKLAEISLQGSVENIVYSPRAAITRSTSANKPSVAAHAAEHSTKPQPSAPQSLPADSAPSPEKKSKPNAVVPPAAQQPAASNPVPFVFKGATGTANLQPHLKDAAYAREVPAQPQPPANPAAAFGAPAASSFSTAPPQGATAAAIPARTSNFTVLPTATSTHAASSSSSRGTAATAATTTFNPFAAPVSSVTSPNPFFGRTVSSGQSGAAFTVGLTAPSHASKPRTSSTNPAAPAQNHLHTNVAMPPTASANTAFDVKVPAASSIPTSNASSAFSSFPPAAAQQPHAAPSSSIHPPQPAPSAAAATTAAATTASFVFGGAPPQPAAVPQQMQPAAPPVIFTPGASPGSDKKTSHRRRAKGAATGPGFAPAAGFGVGVGVGVKAPQPVPASMPAAGLPSGRDLDKLKEDSARHKDSGNRHYAAGSFVKAEEEYTKALQLLASIETQGHDLAVLFSNRAGARLANGKPVSALEDSLTSVKTDPKFTRAYTRAATCYSRLGDFAGAKRILDDMLAKVSASSPHYPTLTAKFSEVEQLERQYHDFVRALGCGKAMDKTKLQEQYAKLQRFMGSVPYCEELAALLAITAIRLEQWSTVPQCLQLNVESEVEAAFTRWSTWIRAQVQYHQGELQAAVELCNTLTQLLAVPTNGKLESVGGWRIPLPAELSSCIALMKKLLEAKEAGNTTHKNADYKEAVRLYTQGLELGGPPAFAAVLYSNRAASHQALSCITDALADCGRAKALNPGYAKAYSRLTTLLIDIQRPEAATDILDALLKRDDISVSAADRTTLDSRLREAKAAASQTKTPHHYKLLGLERSCSEDDVRKAYKKLALRFHPDKALSSCKYARCMGDTAAGFMAELMGGEDTTARLREEANWLFHFINNAHEELSDKGKRSKVDMMLDAEAEASERRSFSATFGARRAASSTSFNMGGARAFSGANGYYPRGPQSWTRQQGRYSTANRAGRNWWDQREDSGDDEDSFYDR